MEQIYQSTVLQALGWAIADSIWQMALLWLIYQLCIAIPVKNNPVVRHMAAVIALFSGAAWFVGNFMYKLITANRLANNTLPVPQGKMNPSVISWMETLLPYLSSAYLVVFVLLMARLIHSIVITQRLRVTENYEVPEWQEFVDHLSSTFSIARKVLIQISDAVNVPATIGFMKPVILLPVASINNLSITQVESIILHEMAHIRRNDYLVNLIVSFIETLLFFNPFTRLLSSQIRKECELCCDDAVVNYQEDPGQYAHALLLLEKSRQNYPLVLAATGKESLLLGRVKRILNQPEQKVKYRHKLLALVLVAGLIMALSLISPAGKNKEELAAQFKQDSVNAPVMSGVSALPMMMTFPLNADKKTIAHIPSTHIQHSDPPHLADRENPNVLKEVPEPVVLPDFPAPPPPPQAPRPIVQEFNIESDMINPEDLQGLVLNSIPEKEFGYVFEKEELEKTLQESAKADQEFRNIIQLKNFNEQQKRQLEELMRQSQRLKKMNEDKMRISSPRRPQSKVKVNGQHEFQDEEILKAFTQTGQEISPRIRTFKDENGMTISIIEDERQIRIHLSGK